MQPSPLSGYKIFITSRGNLIPINQSFPTSPSLVPLPTSNLLSVSAELPILDISYKWNQRVGDLVTFCVVFASVFTFFSFFFNFGCMWALCCGAWTLSSYDEQASLAAHRLSCPGACGILLPLLGIKPMSPALEGGFLTLDQRGVPAFTF